MSHAYHGIAAGDKQIMESKVNNVKKALKSHDRRCGSTAMTKKITRHGGDLGDGE